MNKGVISRIISERRDIMTNKMKFYLSQSLMLLAFAYGSEARILASIMCAIMSVFVAINANSIKAYKRNVGYIVITLLIEAVLLQFTGLLKEVPTLLFLITCNTTSAFLWMETDYDSIAGAMKLNVFVMTLLYILNLIVNNSRFAFLDMFVFISLIFMPLVLCFTYKTIKELFGSDDFENITN